MINKINKEIRQVIENMEPLRLSQESTPTRAQICLLSLRSETCSLDLCGRFLIPIDFWEAGEEDGYGYYNNQRFKKH